MAKWIMKGSNVRELVLPATDVYGKAIVLSIHRRRDAGWNAVFYQLDMPCYNLAARNVADAKVQAIAVALKRAQQTKDVLNVIIETLANA